MTGPDWDDHINEAAWFYEESLGTGDERDDEQETQEPDWFLGNDDEENQ